MEFPKRAGNASIPVALEAGKNYAWCACGLSTAQPLCDGKHRGKTDMKSLVFKAEKTETRNLCSCKLTKNPPFCDGSHK